MEFDVLNDYLEAFTEALKLPMCLRVWDYNQAPELYRIILTDFQPTYVAVWTGGSWPTLVPRDAKTIKHHETGEQIYTW